MDFLEDVVGFLSRHTIGVLSTLGPDGSPQSAAIEYGEMEDGSLVFGTFKTFRKFANLKKDSRVSFVLVDAAEHRTLQWEGRARELSIGDYETYLPRFFAKIPKAEKYLTKVNIVYFHLEPKWMRLSDFSTDPETIREWKSVSSH